MNKILNYWHKCKELVQHPLFFKSGYLAFFTAIGQLMTLLYIIIFARLFSAAGIGDFQVMLSWASLINTISLFSLYYLLPALPDEEMPEMMATMMFILLIFFVGVLLVSLFYHYQYTYALACMVLSYGVVNLFEKLALRFKAVKFVALTRIQIPLLVLILFFIMHLLHVTSIKLYINGFIIVNLLSSVILFLYTLRRHQVGFSFSLTKNVQLVKKYWKNILFVGPSDLLNGLSFNLPIIFLSHYFGNAITGQYSLVLRFCFSPILILSSTLGQVFLSEVGHMIREQSERAYPFFIVFRRFCNYLGLASFLGIFFLFPIIITWFFGAEWHLAAQFSQMLAPMFALMSAVSSTTVIFYLFNKGQFLLISQILYCVSAVLSFGIGIWIHHVEICVILYSVLSCLRYLYLGREVAKTALQLKR